MVKVITAVAAAAFLITPAAFGASFDSAEIDVAESGVHDDGLLWLKVWNNGAAYDVKGTGIYPAPDGPANIYRGELWVGARDRTGNDPDHYYVVSPPEWNGLTSVIMSDEPEWSQVPSYVKREGTLDSFYRMDDSHATEEGPIPLTCEAHGVSWCIDERDDFVALHYRLTNNSSHALDETYVALAYDLDIGGSMSYIGDYVGFDGERKMPYMYDDGPANPYLGLLCVEGTARGAHAWDIMNDPESDEYKYFYLQDPNFDCERDNPYDWRIMLSTGPYDIPAGSTRIVTFAVVAGADLEALRANADTALTAFKAGPPPERAVPSAFNLAQNRPNPVTTYTKITFATRVSAKVDLAVYDLAGRRVDTLADGIYAPGVYDVEWRPREVAPGVYLYTLEAANERFVKAMVVSR